MRRDNDPSALPAVMCITEEVPRLGRSHSDIAKAALEGGIKLIQLRVKDASDAFFYKEAFSLREITAEAGAKLLINDRVDIALAVQADGVHLGQDDMDAAKARTMIKREMLLGVSVDTKETIRRAEDAGADYIGIGPVYKTSSKPDAGEPVGVNNLAYLLQFSSMPVFAIGGINIRNLHELKRTGLFGIAVISSISRADNMEKASSALSQGWLSESLL